MAFADTFKALSDPARRDILEMLKNKPLSAGEIAKQFDMTQVTVSYHLKVLKCAIIQIGVLIKLYIDPRKEQIHHKPVLVSIWIVPLITILINVLIYIIALGGKVSMTMAVFFIIGVMFIGLGNYMPKLKQNYTIGIKVPWTLNSEENWNMTHRMAGKLYVVAGVISIIIALLNNVLSDEVTIIIFMAVFLVTGIGSVAYSFWLYKVKGL